MSAHILWCIAAPGWLWTKKSSEVFGGYDYYKSIQRGGKPGSIIRGIVAGSSLLFSSRVFHLLCGSMV